MDPIDHLSADSGAITGLLAGSPFAGRFRDGAPMLVARGEPARVIFANPAAHALFGTREPRELNAAALAGTSPGARRLRQLAGAATGATTPKLELLRFFVNRAPVQLALLCARLTNARGESFLVAATPPSGQPTGAAAEPLAAEAPAYAAPQPLECDRRSLAWRFVWSAAEPLRFDAPAAPLVEAVGDAAPRAGELFEDWKARTGLDASDELAKALAARATFGPLRLAWPRLVDEHAAAEAIILLLSGAPIFDRQRRFMGYRGFGVVTDETAPLEPRRPIAETKAAAPGSAPLEADAPVAPVVDGVSGVARAPDDATQRSAEGSETAAQAAPERGAEIAPARAPEWPHAGGPNVVPIRPGTLRAVPSPEAGPRRPEDGESIELTTNERDAFREIARALGAKVGDHRDHPVESASSEPQEPAGAAPDHAGEPDQDNAANLSRAATPAAGADHAGAAARNASDLLDRLPIGALVARDGEPLYLNRTLLDLLGYDDLIQFRTAAGPDLIFGGLALDQFASSAGAGALSLVTADGETIATEVQIADMTWDGAPATLISFRRSLEEETAARIHRLELEARARESEARELSAVLDTATDGVVILDSRGAILSLNRPGEALFGFDQKEVVGQDFLTLLAPESRASVKDYFDGLRTGGLASVLNDGREALGRERQGRAIPLFITLGRLNGSPDAKFCAVLRDMTQWKTIQRDLEEARGQAEKASALKSEFLARISHEIRTPLNAVLGFAEVIIDERFGPIGNDRYKEYVKDIHASGAHVMSLVNDLLDLSKIEAGKMELQAVPVDANKIIGECVSLMQPQASRERVIMRLSLAASLPRIIADERSVRQIELNLLSNAVKFNDPGGQVIVATALTEAGQVVIRIRDTGPGMSASDIEMALEPFRQLSNARPMTVGTGLGLPLTKALVEANQASFTIRSKVDQGTLVEVAFPPAQVLAG